MCDSKSELRFEKEPNIISDDHSSECINRILQSNYVSLFNFITSLHGLDCIGIQRKINYYLKRLTGCKASVIVYTPKDGTESFVNIINDDELEEPCILSRHPPDDEKEWDDGLLAALSSHFPQPPSTLHKFPMFHSSKGETMAAVVCLVDCTAILECSDIIRQVVKLSSGLLLSALNLQEERQRKEQCQKLLLMAKNLFLHLGDLVDLMQEITHEARDVTGAERCSLFIVSENGTELVAKVFDGVSTEETEEVRVPINQGVAGHVATTGKMLNIKDVYQHPSFYRNLDEMTGFRTKSMLVFPIRDGKDRIVGVAEMCNKKNGRFFTKLDEEAATALATYCGISLMHSLVYKKIQQSQARVRLVNELLTYHLSVTEECVNQVINCRVEHNVSVLEDWAWPCRSIPLECTPCLSLHMFQSLGLLTSCRMVTSTAVRFILQVRKGYRSVPYHNWYHAFSVTQFSYCVMKKVDMINKGWVTNLEAVALLVATLCHDLDHRGTTNSFQTKSKNTLACLYSSDGSVMEHHHLAQALNILNMDGCNIFENLDHSDYRKVLELIRDLILATDLATHLTRLPQQKLIADMFNPSRADHRSELLALMITSADLSDQVKGWKYSRNIAGLVYEEFFAQGDMERRMGSEPAVMMDRNKADIPVLQVQFLSEVCLPCFQLLAKFLSTLEPCALSVEDNLQRWATAREWFLLPQNKNRPAIDLLNDPALYAFVQGEVV